VLSLSSPPANRCSSPTRDSKTSPSGARLARRSALTAQVQVRGTDSSEAKPRRLVRSVGRRPRSPSNRLRVVRFTAVSAFSRGGPWARRPDLTEKLSGPWNLLWSASSLAPCLSCIRMGRRRVTGSSLRPLGGNYSRRGAFFVFSPVWSTLPAGFGARSCDSLANYERIQDQDMARRRNLDRACPECSSFLNSTARRGAAHAR
jgi:hypothetical protein